WPTPPWLSRARATLGVWRARRASQRGQIMVVCAVALPVLIGFVGVTIDGGYYLATRRAAQNAADAAARAGAHDLPYAPTGNGNSYYSSAGSDGQTVGLLNLSQFPVSSVSISMSYSTSRNVTRDCTLTGSTWTTTTPTSKTRCVKAVVTGSYSTIFL